MLRIFGNMKTLSLLLLLLLSISANANNSGKCGANVIFSYSEDTNTLTISGIGNMSNYDDETDVPWYSFRESIKNAVIEDGVTSIGMKAFFECSNLKSVAIPNSVKNIGSSAFAFCTGITRISLPNSVTTLGRQAFTCCTSLESFTVPNAVTIIEKVLFLECFNLKSVTIPKSVVKIATRAFSGCNGLEKVIIEDVESWCAISFEDNPLCYAHHLYIDENTEITKLNFPNSLKNISDRAFMFCYGLTDVTIPQSTKRIGECAFAGCLNLSNVTITNSQTEIGNYAFNNCPALTGTSTVCQLISSCPDDNHPHIIDLGLDDGTLWACCNVGASVPDSYGDYFAWGETSPKEYYYWNSYKWCEGSDNDFDILNWREGNNKLTKYNYDSEYGIVDNKYGLDLEDDAAYVTWGKTWHMPNSKQLANMINNTIEEEVTFGDVIGMKHISKKNGNYIFMPYCGCKLYTSSYSTNYEYKYWSSSLAPNSEFKGIHASAIGALSCYVPRCYGYPVRPVVFEGEGSASIKNVSLDKNNDKYYTVDGRLLNCKPTQSGVYIINGRKVFVK